MSNQLPARRNPSDVVAAERPLQQHAPGEVWRVDATPLDTVPVPREGQVQLASNGGLAIGTINAEKVEIHVHKTELTVVNPVIEPKAEPSRPIPVVIVAATKAGRDDEESGRGLHPLLYAIVFLVTLGWLSRVLMSPVQAPVQVPVLVPVHVPAPDTRAEEGHQRPRTFLEHLGTHP